MSLWRSKRRYDTSRRFSEQADDALYALALLQSVGSVTETRTDELRDNLAEGIALFETLRDALESPEEVDTYTFTLAREFRKRYGDLDNHAIDRLDRYVSLLERTEADLTYRGDLDDVVEALEIVEELAGQTTERDAKRMKDYVAKSDC